MLSLTSLLIPAIFSSLIGLNDCTAHLGIADVFVDHNVNELSRTQHKTNEYSKDIKNIKAGAVLTKPSGRAYNCFLEINYNCNIFKSENVGAIIGPADFSVKGPKDGKIASAEKPLYEILDEHKAGRWNPSYLKIKEHNATHFVTEISWTFDEATVVVDSVEVFLSNGDYIEDQPIQRSLLNLVCSYPNGNHLNVQNHVLRFNCYIRSEFIKDLFYGARGSGVLLSTLRLAGTDYAYYQVADVSLREPVKQIGNFHAYVSDPPSRAKLCQLRKNKNCGLITYEPQSVEGFKGFPYGLNSPPDGTIPSGNNARFKELNEYGAGRWTRVKFPEVHCYNKTHVSFDLSWYFTALHVSDNIQVYINNENYTPTEPLSRFHLDLNPLCTREFYGKFPPRALTISCPISLEKYSQLSKLNDLLLLSIWNIHDTSFAFYQVIDFEGLSDEQSFENILRKCN